MGILRGPGTGPGDIIVVVKATDMPGDLEFPVKSLKVDKTIEVRGEYGTGSHLPYQLTPGKISFQGSFSVGTWDFYMVS